MINESEKARLQLEQLKVSFLALTKEQREALLSVSKELVSLGPNACKVLQLQVERLAFGARYGDFEQNKNWTEEALQESLDNITYQCVDLLKRRGDIP